MIILYLALGGYGLWVGWNKNKHFSLRSFQVTAASRVWFKRLLHARKTRERNETSAAIHGWRGMVSFSNGAVNFQSTFWQHGRVADGTWTTQCHPVASGHPSLHNLPCLGLEGVVVRVDSLKIGHGHFDLLPPPLPPFKKDNNNNKTYLSVIFHSLFTHELISKFSFATMSFSMNLWNHSSSCSCTIRTIKAIYLCYDTFFPTFVVVVVVVVVVWVSYLIFNA